MPEACSPLDPEEQPFSEIGHEVIAVPNRFGRFIDVIIDSKELQDVGIGVQHNTTRTGVVVAGLTHGANGDEVLGWRIQMEDGPRELLDFAVIRWVEAKRFGQVAVAHECDVGQGVPVGEVALSMLFSENVFECPLVDGASV